MTGMESVLEELTDEVYDAKEVLVLEWRAESLRRAGFDSEAALELAFSQRVDAFRRASRDELDRHDLDDQLPALADQVQPNAFPDQVARDVPQQVVDALDGGAVNGDDQILGAQAGARGRAVRDDLDDLDAASLPERGREPRRQRPWPTGDADPGSAVAALRHQRADHLPRRLVDRHGEPEADPGDGGVDPDDPAEAVCERAARVARIQGGVRLDHVVDEARCGARARGQ